MSVSRILLVAVLVVALVATVAIGGVLVYKQFPGYWMAKAEKSIAAEDYESATIHLRKLLAKDPNNVDAMLLLVDTIRDESEQNGRSRSYLANRNAVEVLARAAELRPSDLELQKRMMRVYLVVGEIGKAAPIAAEVVKSEPTDPDAHFALTWKAVEQKDNAKARQLFAQFENNEIITDRLFQTLWLQHKFFVEGEETEAAEKVLSDSAWKVQQITDEQMGMLAPNDRIVMLELLLRHQKYAEDPQEALNRAKVLIDTSKRLARLELADKTVLANAAANSIALFNVEYPTIKLETSHRVLRDQLSVESESLGTDALADAAERDISAPMLVYWNTARTLMTRGEFDDAIKVINDGIAAAEKLDERYQAGLLDLHLLAARAQISRHRYAEADVHLNKLLGSKRFEGWSHLLKGSVALHQGRLQLAHEEFLKAKASLSDTVLVEMSLAHTHMAREEWAQAIPLLEDLNRPEEQMTDEEKAWYQQLLGGGDRVHFDLLRAKLALKRWDDAQADLRILKDSSLAPNAWGVVVTYLWDDEQDKLKARAYMDKVRLRYPDNLALVLLDARMLKEEGRTVDAAKLIETFAQTNGDEISQLALARWLIRNREPEKALDVLARVEMREGLSPKAINTVNVYRVQALIGASRHDEANRKADELIAAKGTATAGYLMKAALAFQVYRDEKLGIEMLEKALESNPSNPALNMMVQRIKSAQGDFEGVLDLAGNVAGIDKYQGQVQTTVGDALRQLAAAQGAEVALAKADEFLKQQPNDLSLIVLKVDLLISLKRTEEAIALLNVAQQAAPEDLNIPRLKAQAWLAQNEPAKALAEVETATQLEASQGIPEGQGDSGLMVMGAQAALAAGDYPKARVYGVKLSRKEPDSPQGFLLVAESFRKQNDMRNALASLEYYAKRHPNDFAILKTMAGLLNESGQSEKALEILKRAQSGGGGDIRVVISQIELLLKSNPSRKEEAQLLAQQSVGSSRIVDHLLGVAQVFATYNENIDAQNWGERALTVSDATNKAKVHSFLGRIYLRRASQESNASFYDKARTHFELVLETQPDELVAGNNLGWLLATKFNRPDEAVQVLERVRGTKTLNQLPSAYIDTMIDAYLRNKQKQKAFDLSKEAVGVYPTEAMLVYRYGMLLGDSQPLQAKQMLDRAVQLGLSPSDEAEAKRQIARL